MLVGEKFFSSNLCAKFGKIFLCVEVFFFLEGEVLFIELWVSLCS
jgi:hypothetical protein